MIISNGMLEIDIENLLITDKQKNKYTIRYTEDGKYIISDFENKIIKITTLNEIKRVWNNKIKETEDMGVERQLQEMYIFKEEYLIKDEIIFLKNTPIKDGKVYIEFEDNDKILQLDTEGKRKIIIPSEYNNYKKRIYCTYKIKDWVDVVEIKADDCNEILLEDIKEKEESNKYKII